MSEDRVKGSYGIGVGMLLAILLTNVIFPRVPPVVQWLCFLPATAIFVTGCAYYSKSKGYSPYLGVFGFGWIFGLILLILLPDRKDTQIKEIQARFEARRQDINKANANKDKEIPAAIPPEP